jgi:molybdopterin-guanine dinucleotide biosynthesis protein A
LTVPLVGVVLAGGAGRRFGGPKAGVEVEGRAMAGRVADALAGAGASPVVLVGGDPAVADRLGLASVADRWPGEGPLAATATALAWAAATHGPDAVVVVAPCDLPRLDAASVRRLVDALGVGGATVAVGRTPDGRRQPLPAAWRAAAADGVVQAVEGGHRRADALLDALGARTVDLPSGPLVDVDTPADLATLPDLDPPPP